MWQEKLDKLIKAADDFGMTICFSTEIKPGDLYLAIRNQEPQLLTCKEVNIIRNWVVPVEDAYLYDIHECFGLEIKKESFDV